jgi:glycosyltransferase involved in cell wall biosynthesis
VERTKVTVAIPTYNRSNLLGGALASALAQDYPDLQVLVVDNASTDDTEAVVRSFAHPRVSYVRNDSNLGCTGNLNRALELNSSCYLNILMDDDVLLPGFIAESVTLLEEHTDVAFSFTAAKYVDLERAPLGIRRAPDMPAGVVDGLDYLELHVGARQCWIEPSTVVMRCAAAAAVGAFDSPHSKHSDDLNLWFRLASHSRIAFIPEELVEVRMHDGQLSHVAYRTGGYGHYGTIAEQIDAVSYLLQSDRAQDPSYRDWLAGRLRSLHRSQSAQLHGLIPDLHYSPAERLRMLQHDIRALVPEGDDLILADEGELASELSTGRGVLPFLERGGQYYGLPSNDETAIAELERMRRAGGKFMGFAWPAFWWLDYYTGLRTYLYTHFRCALQNSRIIAFDLRA